MSIYNPPSKKQGIFNPSNYGGLGAGGQITTDYLDANYLQFPVAQGNMTLVGTSILGDVTQQGEFITTEDITGETIKATSILVGTTNVITEIGTKQDSIQDGDLTIAKTDGLQTALDNKYDDTGGTIDGDVTITSDLVVGSTNIITEIGTKQDSIQDGDLTIAKTDGLQTALDNKYDDTGGTIGGNVTITGDLVVGTTNVITEIGTKQDTINDGGLTIAKTDGLQTALDNKYDDTGGTIDGDVTITGDLVIGATNVITEIGTKQDTIQDGGLTIAKTDGLQTALNNKYDGTGGTIGGDVTISGDLVVGTTNIISEIGTIQQNNVIFNSNEYGLKSVSNWVSQTAPSAQNYLEVVFASELNLFVAISGSFSGNRIMTSTNGIDWENSISYPDTYLFEIAWSPELSLFVVVFTTAPYVATSSDGKNWTDLSSNAPIGNVIAVSWSAELLLFVAITYNGFVMTSPDGTTWTNRGSQLDGNQGQSLIWSKELNLLVAVSQSGTNRVATSSDGITWNTLPVSLNTWNDIEWSPALGLFVAVAGSGTGNRVMTSSDGAIWTDGTITDRSWETIRWSGDLGIFLAVATDGYIAYSSDGFVWNESVLTGVLGGCCWSPELGTFVVVGNNVVYTSSLKERKPTSDNVFNNEFNSIDEEGNWSFKSLSVGTTNIITELGTKQPTITSATDLSCNSITTTENATIGGTLNVSGSLSNPNQPCFKVIRTDTSTSCDISDNLKFNEATIDNSTAYNSTNFEYTIPVAGNWYFYYSFAGDGDDLKVQLQQNGNIRDELSTFTTTTPVTLPSNYSLGCKGMVIIPCIVNDVIRVRVADGSVSLNHTNELHSFGGFLIG